MGSTTKKLESAGSSSVSESASPKPGLLDRVVQAASDIWDYIFSKPGSPPLEIPYWVSSVLCPLLKRLRRLDNYTKYKPLVYVGGFTTLPRTQTTTFWLRKGFDVCLSQDDMNNPSCRPSPEERHCTLVCAAPDNLSVARSIFDKIVCVYTRAAVLVPTSLLLDLGSILDSLQQISLSTPLSLLGSPGAPPPPQSYTWILKGFRLPYNTLSYTHPGVLTVPGSHLSWRCSDFRDSQAEFQPSNQPSIVALTISETRALSPVDFETLRDNFTKRSISAEESCSLWTDLEAHLKVFLDRPLMNLTFIVLPAVRSAFNHALQGQSLTLGYPCTSCRRLCDPNSISSCFQDSLRVCQLLLSHQRTPYALQRMVLNHFSSLFDKCGLHLSYIDSIYKCLLNPDFLFQFSNRRVVSASRKILSYLLSHSEYGRKTWSSVTSVVATARSSRTSIPQTFLSFLKLRLKEDSVLLDNGFEPAQESLRDFFLQIEADLGFTNTASTVLPGGCSDMWGHSPSSTCDPQAPSVERLKLSVCMWNVNGLAARWKSKTFQHSVAAAGYPDVLVLTEPRIRSQSARNLKGFSDWCSTHSYNYCYWHWSSKPKDKGGAGYGGVCILSRVKASHVAFGLPGYCQPEEARCITAIFSSLSLFAVYSPNSGGKNNPRFLHKRLQFDKCLRQHMLDVITKHLTVPWLLAGDLNVAPRPCDYHPKVFDSIPASISASEPTFQEGFYPSISSAEVESYTSTLSACGGANLGEILDKGSRTKTWFPLNQFWARSKGFGARLDHYVGSKSLLNPSSKVRALSVRTLWRVGDSDHVPVVLDLAVSSEPPPPSDALTNTESTPFTAVSDISLLSGNCALPPLTPQPALLSTLCKSLSINDTPSLANSECTSSSLRGLPPLDDTSGEDSDSDFDPVPRVQPPLQTFFSDVCDEECRSASEGGPPPPSYSSLESFTPQAVTQPMPFVNLHLQGSNPSQQSAPTELVKVLLDSGSRFNLLSPALALSLAQNNLTASSVDVPLPRLQSANGQVEEALACLRINIQIPGFAASAVSRLFYVMPNLPIPAILGATTFRSLQCSMDWSTSQWSYSTPIGARFHTPFVVDDQCYWQPSAVLTTLRSPVTIPAGSHAKVNVRLGNGFTPSQSLSDDVLPVVGSLPGTHPHLRVAVGISNLSPSWIQMSNTSAKSITLPALTPVASVQYLPSAWYSVQADRDLDATAYLCDSKSSTGSTQPPSYHEWFSKVDLMSTAEIEHELSQSPLSDVDFKSMLSTLSEECITKLKRWTVKRKPTFSDGTFVPTEPIHNTTMRIQTTVPDPSLRSYPYRMSPVDCEHVRSQINEWKKSGVIQDSVSPWSSNVVLVRHPDKKPRVAIDYRKLNSHTVKDAYMLPRVDHVFDVLNGARFISATDCHSAFLQIPIADARSRELTAFVAPDGGLYEFLRCPFGLVNAPSVWQRLIDNVMADYKWKFALTYVDDICIFTKSDNIDDHIRDLDLVFDRLDMHGLCVKASKTFLARQELPFLGHLIGVDGIKPDPRKLAAITEMPLPTSLKQLRSSLGTFSYYRKFVKNFSKMASPLQALMKKDQSSKRCVGNKIEYTPDQTNAFQALKEALTSEPVCLSHPDWSLPFEVHTDASKQGLGAVLCQKTEQGEKVVMYASRSTTDLESTAYSQYELEACALVWSTTVFRHYLYGRKFLVKTDCGALKWLKDHKNPLGRIARWVMHLLEYDFDVVHRAGLQNSNADGLSRNPLLSTAPYDESPVAPLYTYLRASAAPLYTYLGKPVIDFALAMRMRTRSMARATEAPSVPPVPAGPAPQADSALSPPEQQRSTPPVVNEVSNSQSYQDMPFQRVHTLTHQYFAAEDRVAWEVEKFAALQKADPQCEELRAECTSAENSRFAIDSRGLLVLKKPAVLMSSVSRKRKRSKRPSPRVVRDRIVVPETLKAFVLYLHHGLPVSGHQGRSRTIAAISERFWWKGLTRDVRRWVRSCVPCQRRKCPRPLRAGLAESMSAPHPWHTVAIDFVGPCPETSDGCVWILTMIDTFTRWPIAIPLPNRKAATVQRALHDHLFSVYGFPTRLLSDQGKEFIDAGLHSLCSWLGVQKIATTGYQPQANGHIERFHRYMNSAMTSLASGNIAQWDLYLSSILFSYRVSICESTGYSPFFLTFGRHPSLPSDLLMGLSHPSFESEHSYAESLATSLSQAYEFARSKQFAAADRNMKRLNATRKEVSYEVGQQVFYWFDKSSEKSERPSSGAFRVTIPEKWRSWWQGPYTITSKISDKLFVLDVSGRPTTVNVNRLLSVPSWNSYITDTSPSDHWTIGASSRPSSDPAHGIVEHSAPLRPARVGDLVCWPLSPSSENPLPFGLGQLVRLDANDLCDIQWFGNYAMKFDSTFRPCWLEPKTNRIYYSSSRAHRSHLPHCTSDTSTVVHTKDFISFGFSLLPSDRLPASVLRVISSHEDVTSFLP